jgi:hypothetical protein
MQLSHKNPWKTALVIVGFVFLTAALSTAGWFYHYSPLQQVPPPSAQTLRATRPVARIMADPQAASLLGIVPILCLLEMARSVRKY